MNQETNPIAKFIAENYSIPNVHAADSPIETKKANRAQMLSLSSIFKMPVFVY